MTDFDTPTHSEIDVRVVTVTYNSGDCIRQCIESVLNQESVRVELVVVDNDSQDGTGRVVREFGKRVHLVENRDNCGFGTACNQGAHGAQSRYVYFLNPDAQLTSPQSIRTLIDQMERRPRWGVCGTRIADKEGLPCVNSYPGQRHLRNPLPPLPGEIAWIVGASMFFRRNVFEAVGGFDEKIFLYAEEIDICLKTRKAGHEIGMVADVTIDHIGGVSEEPSDLEGTWTRKLTGLSQFYRNHYEKADIRMLWRRDLARARWRLFWQSVSGGRSSERIAKYNAMRDVARAQLKALDNK